MSPEEYIASLDRDLAGVGETITLRRVVGSKNQQYVDVDCVAKVVGQGEKDLVGTLAQDELYCILSPTQINQRQWPGGQAATAGRDPRVPDKSRGDLAKVRGAWRAVEWAEGIFPQGVLVRVNMRVKG
jgi:hypothetical protein